MYWTTETHNASGWESGLCLLLTLCAHVGCQRMTTSVEQTTVEHWLLQGISHCCSIPVLSLSLQSRLSAERVMEQSIQTSMCYASLLFVKFKF